MKKSLLLTIAFCLFSVLPIFATNQTDQVEPVAYKAMTCLTDDFNSSNSMSSNDSITRVRIEGYFPGISPDGYYSLTITLENPKERVHVIIFKLYWKIPGLELESVELTDSAERIVKLQKKDENNYLIKIYSNQPNKFYALSNKSKIIANLRIKAIGDPWQLPSVINFHISNIEVYGTNNSLDTGIDYYLCLMQARLGGDLYNNGLRNLADAYRLGKLITDQKPNKFEIFIGDLNNNHQLDFEDIEKLLSNKVRGVKWAYLEANNTNQYNLKQVLAVFVQGKNLNLKNGYEWFNRSYGDDVIFLRAPSKAISDQLSFSEVSLIKKMIIIIDQTPITKYFDYFLESELNIVKADEKTFTVDFVVMNNDYIASIEGHLILPKGIKLDRIELTSKPLSRQIDYAQNGYRYDFKIKNYQADDYYYPYGNYRTLAKLHFSFLTPVFLGDSIRILMNKVIINQTKLLDNYLAIAVDYISGVKVRAMPNPLSMKIYPNATKGPVNFDCDQKISGQSRIKVYNERGLVVSTILNQYQSRGSSLTDTDLSNLPTGSYWAVFSVGSAKIAKQLIIAR